MLRSGLVKELFAVLFYFLFMFLANLRRILNLASLEVGIYKLLCNLLDVSASLMPSNDILQSHLFRETFQVISWYLAFIFVHHMGDGREELRIVSG